MSENLKLALLAALRRILEPLARLMVDAGIGVGEFQELAKVAFVKAARDRTPTARKASQRRTTRSSANRYRMWFPFRAVSTSRA